MADRSLTLDLSVPVRFEDLPALAKRAFDWWAGELAAHAPAFIRNRLSRASETALLFADGAAWHLQRPDGEALSIDAGLSDAEIAALLPARSAESSRVTLVLPRHAVLRRRVELPLLSDSRLRAAVELQIDRYSPFKVDDVRFAVRALERDTVESKLIADVAIVPRAPLDALERRLEGLGFKVVAVDAANDDGGREGFDFRTTAPAGDNTRARLITAALACGVGLIWYLASYAWGAARDRELASWTREIAALRPAAERSMALHRQLDGIAEPLALARAHQPGAALGDLLELTELLPDDARLTEIKFTGDTIELAGLALNAPTLIAKLEASKRFKDVKFRSPVTRRPEMNKDRFEIAMTREAAR